MKPTTASKLAAACFGGPAPGGRAADPGTRCACCGGDVEGVVHNYVPGKTFNDLSSFARPGGREVCASCMSLLLDDAATAGHSGSGAATKEGFRRLLSNMERLDFLADPPAPPFAVAVITAKRQHVWWMARVAYDRDLIPVQFGHRALVVDRRLAVQAADAILEYERATEEAARTDRSRKTTFVLVPLTRDLKSSSDGQYTLRFQLDQGNQALALKSLLSELTLGDLWAAAQLRAAARELKVGTVAEAKAALDAAKASAPPGGEGATSGDSGSQAIAA